MSPIIELQRRLVEKGRIRAGEKGEKGEPRKLDKWRLTSKDKVCLDAAAERWGGEVREWDGHKGEYELYTEQTALPIMLIPGQLPSTWYELWSKGGCQRRCDGQHELISDSSCLCVEERECKPYTRLSVLLSDLPGIGSWLLTSTGWNAAAELAGSADLLQRATAQGVLIPARLRLEQRVSVTGGQTRRFAVPVIDLDISFGELLGGNQGGLPTPSDSPALPSGYKPIAKTGGNGSSLEDGLQAVEAQALSRTPRSAAPIPAIDETDFGGAPLPPDTSGALPPSPASAESHQAADASKSGAPEPVKPTTRQKNQIGVYIASLRDLAGAVTTEQLWAKLATARGEDVDEMIERLGGYSIESEDASVLHFGPLLADLNREEASRLIDWFERVEAKVSAGTVA